MLTMPGLCFKQQNDDIFQDKQQPVCNPSSLEPELEDITRRLLVNPTAESSSRYVDAIIYHVKIHVTHDTSLDVFQGTIHTAAEWSIQG